MSKIGAEYIVSGIKRSFASGKPFQPNLMFASKAAAYPSEATFQCSAFKDVCE
jgi:hypothetical protein